MTTSARLSWRPTIRIRRPVAGAALLAFIASPGTIVAQHGGAVGGGLTVGALTVPVYDRVSSAPGGGSISEVRIVQPTMMVHGAWLDGRLRLTGMVNLEGATMPDGHLAPGAWGEGFVDRRHPHTYLHELVVSVEDVFGRLDRGASVSLAAGKGFPPFGTDDPMSRPPLRYPVNHHLAQILERVIAIAAVRAGPVTVEAGLFNGDEPERPSQWPNFGRFGDSWATRLTLAPSRGVEIQGSYARVVSPEHRRGSGLTQDKLSASARFERQFDGGSVYGLAEWARTDEADGFFRFSSVLVEGAWLRGRHRLLYRFERTERPEEERELNLFRSARPHHDNSIVGTTRWTMHTAGYRFDALTSALGFRVSPIVEASFGRVESLTPVSFDPAAFYGRDTVWQLTIGVRLGWGARLHRMGRYGAAVDSGGMDSLTHDH